MMSQSEIKEYKRLWYLKNRTKVRKQQNQKRKTEEYKAKQKIWDRERYLKNRDKVIARYKKWVEKNKDRFLEVKKRYNASDRGKYKNHKYYETKLKENRQESMRELKDSYIYLLLRGNGILNPTKEMVEEKRLSIKIKRHIRKLNKTNEI